MDRQPQFSLREIHHRETFDRANRIIEQYATPIESFYSVYPHEEVQKDQENVRILKQLWENQERDSSNLDRQIQENARIAEAILMEQFELSNWGGSNVETAPASEFDDIFSNTDVVMFFSDGTKNNIAIAAVDITFSKKTLRKKFQTARSTITDGTLKDLKYVHSDQHNIHGPVADAVPLVLSISGQNFETVKTQWLQRDAQKLGENPFRFLALEQMLLQIEAMQAFAAHHNHAELLTKCNQMQRLLISGLDSIELSDRNRDYMQQNQNLQEMKAALINTYPEAKEQLERPGFVIDRIFSPEELEYTSTRSIEEVPIASQLEGVPDVAATEKKEASTSQWIGLTALTERLRTHFDNPHLRAEEVLKAAHLLFEHQKQTDLHQYVAHDARGNTQYSEQTFTDLCTLLENSERIKQRPDGWITNLEMTRLLREKKISAGYSAVKKVAQFLSGDVEPSILPYKMENNRTLPHYSLELQDAITEWFQTHALKEGEAVTVLPFAEGAVTKTEMREEFASILDWWIVDRLWKENGSAEYMRSNTGKVRQMLSKEAAENLRAHIRELFRDSLPPQPGEKQDHDLAEEYKLSARLAARIVERQCEGKITPITEVRKVGNKLIDYFTSEALKIAEPELRRRKELLPPQPGEMTFTEAAEKLTAEIGAKLYGSTLRIFYDTNLGDTAAGVVSRKGYNNIEITYLTEIGYEKLYEHIVQRHFTPEPREGEVTQKHFAAWIRANYNTTIDDANTLVKLIMEEHPEIVQERRAKNNVVYPHLIEPYRYIDEVIDTVFTIPSHWVSVSSIAEQVGLTSGGVRGQIWKHVDRADPSVTRVHKNQESYFNPDDPGVQKYIANALQIKELRERAEREGHVTISAYITSRAERFPKLVPHNLKAVIRAYSTEPPISFFVPSTHSYVLTPHGIEYFDALFDAAAIPDDWVTMHSIAAKVGVDYKLVWKWIDKLQNKSEVTKTSLYDRELYVDPTTAQKLIDAYHYRNTATERIPEGWIDASVAAEQYGCSLNFALSTMRYYDMMRPESVIYETRISGTRSFFYSPESVTAAFDIAMKRRNEIQQVLNVPSQWVPVEELATSLQISISQTRKYIQYINYCADPSLVVKGAPKENSTTKTHFYYSPKCVEAIKAMHSVEEDPEKEKSISRGLVLLQDNEIPELNKRIRNAILRLQAETASVDTVEGLHEALRIQAEFNEHKNYGIIPAALYSDIVELGTVTE